MSGLAALLGLAGGLGMFVFGMRTCSEGLQKMTARRLKGMVGALTSRPLLGMVLGAAVTLGLQSSSATAALVIGMVSASLMTLAQALGVMLGSSLGASLTAQLIVFRLVEMALALLFGGAVLYLFSKRSRTKNLGQTLLGIGLIFYGMNVMALAMEPIRGIPALARILAGLERFVLLEFLMGMALTALLQSSPAFLALLMTLASHQLIGMAAVIPYVLGAHLGGAVTGLLSGLGAPGIEAKRAALANFGFKLVNALVFLPFSHPLGQLILGGAPEISRGIANAHTFFSLAMAVGFLPLTRQVAAVMERLVPEPGAELGDARLLSADLLELPELAVDQAHRQTAEMGGIVSGLMLDYTLANLRYSSEDTYARLSRTERAVDSLYRKISGFLSELGNGRLSEALMQRTIQILYAANDLEHVGDILINVARIARKIEREELQFSEEGWEEIRDLHQQVSANFHRSLAAFELGDRELAIRVIKEHPRIVRAEKGYRYSHFERMQSGNPRTIATSSVHLDLIESLLRIDGHAVSIAHGVLGIV